MGFMDSLFGSSSSVKSRSVLSADQQALLSQVAGYLQSGLNAGASTSQYGAYTATPASLTNLFSNMGNIFGANTQTLAQAFGQQLGGAPAYTFDPGATTKRFETTFAQPMMASWRENVLPVVQEQYNLPGVAGSSMAARAVSNAANQFYGESIAPQLFNALQSDWSAGVASLENAAARQMSGISGLLGSATQIGQMELSENERILAALRGEESRMFAENNPFLQAALGLSTAQTVENIGMQGSSGLFGNLLSGATGLASLGNSGVGLSDIFSFFS